MTCADATLLFTRIDASGLLSLTRAERVALGRHFKSCPVCAAYVRRRADEERRRLGEDHYRRNSAAGIALAQEDYADPETSP